MSSGETPAHLELKRLAVCWALANRLPLVGVEVRVPKSAYRADVAALSRHPVGEYAVTALFECKQARSDFICDGADEPALSIEVKETADRLTELRKLIGGHRPDLRRGDSLFPEFDDYDFTGLKHDALHEIQRRLEILQRKVVEGVKFARLHRYHAADHLYLVTEPGIVHPHEVPAGWGWLERDGASLVVKQPPERHMPSADARLAWLENVAIAGARAAKRQLGVPFNSPAPA
jgi:hypothetical protein